MKYLRCLLVGIVLCSLGTTATAQSDDGRFSLVVRGIPLKQALDELVRLTRIDLVYASELVAGKHTYCAQMEVPVETLLTCVLTGSGLDYVRSSSGAYVLINALEQPPRFGHLTGRVVDRETGEPLPFANVLLADARAGTVTNEAGLFSFANVLSGPHRLVVSYVGYATQVDSVWVEPGGQHRHRTALQADQLSFEPIVIDGLAQRVPSSDLGLGTVMPRDLTDVQGIGTADVARSAGRLPGVTAQQPLADLHIQGSSSGEHLTLLDGAPVRNPVSLGRHLGAFSPLALQRLRVHKAGFGAEHGSHLAGIIAIDHDLAEPNARGVSLSLDPVSANAKAQHRWTWGRHGQGMAMAALRTSVWDVYQDVGIQNLLESWNTADPLLASLWLNDRVTRESLRLYRQQPGITFSDAHAATRLQLSPFRHLSMSFYRGKNHIEADQTAVNLATSGSEDQLMTTHDVYDWLNWAAQATHSWLLGARSVASVQVRGSWHTSSYAYQAQRAAGTDLDDPAQRQALEEWLRADMYGAAGSSERNHIRELAAEATFHHSLTPRAEVEMGLQLEQTASDFDLGNLFIAPFSYDGAVWNLAWYGKGSFSRGWPVVAEPSLRLTWVPVRGAVYAEPRLALRYDRPWRTDGSLALRVAGGLYRQFVNQFELTSVGATAVVPSVLFWLPVDRSMAPSRVYHLAGEALLAPSPHWRIDLEAYVKAQPRLLTIDYLELVRNYPAQQPEPPSVPLRQDEFLRATTGRAYGGSLRVQYSGERLTPAVTYSYSHAVRRYPRADRLEAYPVPWNEPHRLALDLDAALPADLTLSVNWTGIWGRTWGLRKLYYDYLFFDTKRPVSFTPFDPARPDRQTLPPQTHLDAGLTFERSLRVGSLQLRAYVINVLGRANVYDRSLEPIGDGITQPVDRVLPGRHVTFSARVTL